MPAFTLRPAIPADAAAIAAQMIALWPDENAADFPPDLEHLTRHVSNDAPRAILVAEAAGACIGFVAVGTRGYAEGCDTTPVGFVEGWFVQVDWRRRGVGGALLGAAEAWAKAQGFREMGSDTWLDNEGSISAHVAAGFREVERIVCFAKALD